MDPSSVNSSFSIVSLWTCVGLIWPRKWIMIVGAVLRGLNTNDLLSEEPNTAWTWRETLQATLMSTICPIMLSCVGAFTPNKDVKSYRNYYYAFIAVDLCFAIGRYVNYKLARADAVAAPAAAPAVAAPAAAPPMMEPPRFQASPSTECAICLDQPRNSRVLPCGHRFCTGCIAEHRRVNGATCPMCRASIV